MTRVIQTVRKVTYLHKIFFPRPMTAVSVMPITKLYVQAMFRTIEI